MRCGDCRDGRPTAAQREVQAKIGRNFLGFGIFAIVAAIAVWQIHANHFPGNEFIQPWYDEMYEAGGKPALRGDDYTSWAETGGMVMCGIGVLAMIVARLNAGRRRTR